VKMVYMINVDSRHSRYLCRVPLTVGKMLENKVTGYGYASQPWGEDSRESHTPYEIQESSRWIGLRRMIGVTLDRWER
jgi:hypothetical protein